MTLPGERNRTVFPFTSATAGLEERKVTVSPFVAVVVATRFVDMPVENGPVGAAKVMVWSSLPASLVRVGPFVGVFVLPIPNWPPSLNPLAKRAPDASRVKVWNPPPAISLAPKSAGTSVGRNSL